MNELDLDVSMDEYAIVGLGKNPGRLNENAYRSERSAVTGTKIPRRDSYNGNP